MRYICVRTYGNGCHQNKIFPWIFGSLEMAENKCQELNSIDVEDNTDKWIPFPLYEEDRY